MQIRPSEERQKCARNKNAYDRDPVMKKFIDVATETVFGAPWGRPGLDFKTRTPICVVSDAASSTSTCARSQTRFE